MHYKTVNGPSRRHRRERARGQLAGMDFYDAAVRLDDISAVVVKARIK